MAVLSQFPKSRLSVWDADFLHRLRRLGIVVYESRDGIDLRIGETGIRICAERHRRHTTKASFYGENTDARRVFGSTSLWFAVSRELKWHLDKTTDPGQRIALMAVIASL